MLFEKMLRDKDIQTDRDKEVYNILHYLIGFRSKFYAKNPTLTWQQKEDMEMEMYMLAIEKYESWDKSKGIKFLTYIYRSFGLTFSNFVIKNITGINVKRWDCMQHKKETGKDLVVNVDSMDARTSQEGKTFEREINERLADKKTALQTPWEEENNEWLKCFGAQ